MKAPPSSSGLSVSRLESKEESNTKDESNKFETSPRKKVTPSPHVSAIKPRKHKDGPDVETSMSAIPASSDGSIEVKEGSQEDLLVNLD